MTISVVGYLVDFGMSRVWPVRRCNLGNARTLLGAQREEARQRARNTSFARHRLTQWCAAAVLNAGCSNGCEVANAGSSANAPIATHEASATVAKASGAIEALSKVDTIRQGVPISTTTGVSTFESRARPYRTYKNPEQNRTQNRQHRRQDQNQHHCRLKRPA